MSRSLQKENKLKSFNALRPNSTETFQQSETARVILYTHGHRDGSLGIRLDLRAPALQRDLDFVSVV